MAKGVGTKSKSPEAPKESFHVGTPEKAQQIVNELSNKELYGFDAYNVRNKGRLSIGDGKITAVSKAVALVGQSEGNDAVLLCTAFLKRLGVIRYNETVTRRTLFDGTDASGNVQPMEMKYAVLRLLGVDEKTCRKHCGYRGVHRVGLSSSFDANIKRVENDRLQFLFNNPKMLPGAEAAINRIRNHSNIAPGKIFGENGVPPLRPSQEDGETQLSLAAALSILGLALEKGIPVTVAYENDTNPFSPEILALIESRMQENVPKRQTETVE